MNRWGLWLLGATKLAGCSACNGAAIAVSGDASEDGGAQTSADAAADLDAMVVDAGDASDGGFCSIATCDGLASVPVGARVPFGDGCNFCDCYLEPTSRMPTYSCSMNDTCDCQHPAGRD
jgi:hypothetical protein